MTRQEAQHPARLTQPLLFNAQRIAFYLLLAYAAILTIPISFRPIAPGLDPSWAYAVNYFAASRYKYGPDVIFTLGPLGFVYVPQNLGSNLIIALLIRSLVWALLVSHLAAAYRRLRFARLGCFLAVLSLILAHPIMGFIDYMIASAALLLILWDAPERHRFGTGTLPLSVLTTLAFLIKFTAFIILIPSLIAYFALAYLREHRTPSRASFLRLAVVLLAPFAAYLIYHPSLTGLWMYLIGSQAIASGYSTAMSTLGLLSEEYFRFGLFVGLMIGFALYGTWRRWLSIEVVACVLVVFFFAFKHGAVRSYGRLPATYALGLLLFGLLALKSRGGATPSLWIGVVWVGLAVISVSGMNPVWRMLSAERWNPLPHLRLVRSLLYWKQTSAVLATQTEANLRADRLPVSLLTRIEHAPVVVFPWELTYGPANDLNLTPLYTLQAYAAYTNTLDRTTADRLLAKSPPETRLLMEWKSIDGRHPLLDTPATWEVIYTGFQPELAEPNLLLLKKRDSLRVVHFRPLSQATPDIRQWQNVPDRGHAVSVSVSLVPNLRGRLRGILYKTNPVYLELETVDRNLSRFRAVPDVLRHPFTINCLPLDAADLEILLFDNVCQQRVQRFRFSGEGLESFSSFAEVTFAEAPAELLRMAEKRDLGLQLTNISPNAPIWTGSVDALNGLPVPLTTAGNPVTLSHGERLEIQGWAASPEKSGATFDAVYVILGGRQLRALVSIRPDVASYYNNPRLGRAGFSISIDTSTLPKGIYALTMAGVTRENAVYRSRGEIYIRLE